MGGHDRSDNPDVYLSPILSYKLAAVDGPGGADAVDGVVCVLRQALGLRLVLRLRLRHVTSQSRSRHSHIPVTITVLREFRKRPSDVQISRGLGPSPFRATLGMH